MVGVIVYEAMINGGEFPDIDGMRSVSALFGMFIHPIAVSLLPALYPGAYAAALSIPNP